MNRVFSTKEPIIVNGADMEPGDFGIIVQVLHGGLMKINDNVFRSDTNIVKLATGATSNMMDLYSVKLQDSLTLQRIK